MPARGCRSHASTRPCWPCEPSAASPDLQDSRVADPSPPHTRAASKDTYGVAPALMRTVQSRPASSQHSPGPASQRQRSPARPAGSLARASAPHPAAGRPGCRPSAPQTAPDEARQAAACRPARGSREEPKGFPPAVRRLVPADSLQSAAFNARASSRHVIPFAGPCPTGRHVTGSNGSPVLAEVTRPDLKLSTCAAFLNDLDVSFPSTWGSSEWSSPLPSH